MINLRRISLSLLFSALVSGAVYSTDLDLYSSAMGTSYESLTANINAVNYNPAGIADLVQKEMSVSSYFLPAQNIVNDLKFIIPLKYGAMSTSVSYFNSKDSNALDSFTGMVGYAYPVYKDERLSARKTVASAGINIKLINKNLESRNSTVMAADLGLIYGLEFLNEGLAASLRISNLGGEYEFDGIKTAIDTKFDINISQRDLIEGLSLALKIGKLVEDYNYFGTGVSYDIGSQLLKFDKLSLMAGYLKDENDNSNLTSGFSLEHFGCILDYAVCFGNEDTEATNLFSLNVRFGAEKKDFNDIEVLYQEAMKNYFEGNLKLSRKQFEEVILMDREYKEAGRYISVIRRTISQLQKEKPVSSKNSSKTQTMMDLGDKFFEMGKYQDAIKYYVPVLVVDKSNSEVKEKIKEAKRMIREKAATAEIKQTKKLSVEFEKKIESYYSSGQRYFENKKYAQALSQYRKGINSVNRSSAWWSKFNKAIKKTKSEQAEIYYEKGYIYYQQNKFEESVEQFNKALQYNPYYEEAKEKVKEVQAKIKKINSIKAEKLYEDAMEQYTAGNISEAIKLWEQVLEYDKNHIEAKKALERVRAIKR